MQTANEILGLHCNRNNGQCTILITLMAPHINLALVQSYAKLKSRKCFIYRRLSITTDACPASPKHYWSILIQRSAAAPDARVWLSAFRLATVIIKTLSRKNACKCKVFLHSYTSLGRGYVGKLGVPSMFLCCSLCDCVCVCARLCVVIPYVYVKQHSLHTPFFK